MKRGAERQIQREDGDDPYAVDGDSGGGGSTGMEGENQPIASRPIRGMPKKKTLGMPTPSFAQTPSPTPFTFAGFGTTAASSTPAKPPSTSSDNSLFSGFDRSSASNSISFPSSSTSTSSTTPFSFSNPTKTTIAATTSNGSVKAGSSDSEEVDYFCALRGLNLSLKSQLVESLENEIRKDPFCNLSQVLKAMQSKYDNFRKSTEEKRKGRSSTETTNFVASTTASSSAIPASSATAKSLTSTPLFSLPAASTQVLATASPNISTASSTSTTPSFTLPKPPATGGFSFAGSSFSTSAPTKEAASTASLLPGQPTFSLPPTGFYSKFGKEEDEEKDEEEDHGDEGGNDAAMSSEATNKLGDKSNIEDKASVPSTTAASDTNPINPFASSAPPAFSSPFGGTAKSTFSFGSAASNSATFPVINPTSNSAFRFGFGSTTNSEDKGESKEEDKESSSPVKVPSIGSNFANTSGVKQGGAFSFGSSKINFGSSSPSPFGNAAASTGFTFGSSPTKDSSSSNNSEESKK